jgi:dimethylargininase
VKIIMRPPSEAFRRALSKHPLGDQIDPVAAMRQHKELRAKMTKAGADIVLLPADPDLPDAPFVQDVIVSFPRPDEPEGRCSLLVATRPGAPSRRPEVPSVLAVARRLVPPVCRVLEIEEPGTLDGGDVLVYGRRVVIGLSGRTNRHGAEQLHEAVSALGYRAFLCPVSDDRLHFASAITRVRPGRFIGTQRGYDDLDAAGPEVLPREEIERIVIPDEEIVAHNVVLIRDSLFVPSGNPVSVGLLRAAGEHVVEVDFEHFTRADAGLTCLMGMVH